MTRAFTSGLGSEPCRYEHRRLGDVLEALIDHRGKTATKLGGEFVDSGVRVISAIHIKNGRVCFEKRDRFVTQEIFERWMPRRTRVGDVLLTSEAPLGAVAVVENDEPLVLSQRLFGLRGLPGVLSNSYLKHFLGSPVGQAQLAGRSSGSTVTGIRQRELRQILIPVPSLDEQEFVASLLDQELSRLDAALPEAELRARGKILQRSLLHCAFSGQLVPQDGSDEPASRLLERTRAGKLATHADRRRR